MIELSGPKQPVNISLNLSGSKSISNRLLILNHVLKRCVEPNNISDAEDTVLLKKALAQIQNKKAATIDVHHAGTDMRFLTALLSVTVGDWMLTGSERLKQRPIGELVNCLRKLGASIKYLENEGFPPLKIIGKKLSGGTIDVDGSISSQFISALLLISPCLEQGLILNLEGAVVSRPYINMTIELLADQGVKIKQEDNVITVQGLNVAANSNHQSSVVEYVESDWSSASYWYSICALSPGSQISLNFFNEKSLQADAVLALIFVELGVNTVFENNKLILTQKPIQLSEFTYDFTDCPDIAQTIAVTCFGLKIKANLSGLKTLHIKETDRIAALKIELEKFGAIVNEHNDTLSIDNGLKMVETIKVKIDTYNDHRMAMSFAPLSLVYGPLTIKHPDVVQKSYPRFWEDLKNAGFNVNLIP